MLKNLKVFVALGGLRPLLQSAVQHAHGTSLWHPGLEDHPTVVNHREYRGEKRRAIYFWIRMFFFAAGFGFCLGSWFYAFLFLWFSAFLLLCFSASLLFAFPAPFYFYFYYSTFSFLQSCVFAALLPAPLLLCFLSLLPLCFFFSFASFSPVCILNEALKTLGETQRNPKEILIRTLDKKPLYETLNEP